MTEAEDDINDMHDSTEESFLHSYRSSSPIPPPMLPLNEMGVPGGSGGPINLVRPRRIAAIRDYAEVEDGRGGSEPEQPAQKKGMKRARGMNEDMEVKCPVPTGLFNVVYANTLGSIEGKNSANETTTRVEYAFKVCWTFTLKWRLEKKEKEGSLVDRVVNEVDGWGSRNNASLVSGARKPGGDEEDVNIFEMFDTISFKEINRKMVDEKKPIAEYDGVSPFKPEQVFAQTILHERSEITGSFKIPSWKIPVSNFVPDEGHTLDEYHLILFIRPKNGFCGSLKSDKYPIRFSTGVSKAAAMDDEIETWYSKVFIATSKAFPGQANGNNPTREVHDKKKRALEALTVLNKDEWKGKREWYDNGSEGTRNRIVLFKCDAIHDPENPLIDQHGEKLVVTPQENLIYMEQAAVITASGDNQIALWSMPLEESYVSEFIASNDKSKTFMHYRFKFKANDEVLTIRMMPCANEIESIAGDSNKKPKHSLGKKSRLSAPGGAEGSYLSGSFDDSPPKDLSGKKPKAANNKGSLFGTTSTHAGGSLAALLLATEISLKTEHQGVYSPLTKGAAAISSFPAVPLDELPPASVEEEAS